MNNIITLVFSALLFTITSSKAALVARLFSPAFVTPSSLSMVFADGKDLIADNGYFEGLKSSQNAISLVVLVSPESPTFWMFAFAAPEGQVLTPGHYANTVRYNVGTGSNPSMDVSGNGYGSNLVGGYFDVLEIGWDENGKVNKAAIDFYHVPQNNPAAITHGSLRHNSTMPLTNIPEPGAPILLFTSFLFTWRRNRCVAR